jgi:dihydropteroate synthase
VVNLPPHWQLRSRRLELPRAGDGPCRPLLMGIVNVTPDSFSDGGAHADVETAVAHGLALAAEGADILDVGGESTRPFSTPVAAAEEWRRVAVVVERLVAESGLPVSIDTAKASVAARAIEAGAEIINDVTGLAGDPDMIGLAISTRPGICCMHMRGTPQTMQIDPRYDDVVAEVRRYLLDRRDLLLAAGFEGERICLDPGIGFGKTHEHNLELMRQASRFLDLGCPILVGHSRKGFLGKIIRERLGREPTIDDRDLATAAGACSLAAQGIQIIRVHAVGMVRTTLEAFLACRESGPAFTGATLYEATPRA